MYLSTYVMWRVTCVAVEFWAQLSHCCTSFYAVKVRPLWALEWGTSHAFDFMSSIAIVMKLPQDPQFQTGLLGSLGGTHNGKVLCIISHNEANKQRRVGALTFIY